MSDDLTISSSQPPEQNEQPVLPIPPPVSTPISPPVAPVAAVQPVSPPEIPSVADIQPMATPDHAADSLWVELKRPIQETKKNRSL